LKDREAPQRATVLTLSQTLDLAENVFTNTLAYFAGVSKKKKKFFNVDTCLDLDNKQLTSTKPPADL
jgi:hypothetical protein